MYFITKKMKIVLETIAECNPYNILSINYSDIYEALETKCSPKLLLALPLILTQLFQDGYITYTCKKSAFSDIKLTYKAIDKKAITLSILKNWLSSNFISILALIVAIIALFK